MPNPTDVESKFRSVLTFVVVCISITGIFILSWIVLKAKNDLPTAQFVFGAVLPLLASWIGTIMAFYFSKDNFQAANQAVTDMTKAMTAMDRLKSIPVAGKMRSLKDIKSAVVKQGDEAKNKLVDLFKTFDGYERMLILAEDKSVRYLIYRAMADKFLSQRLLNPPAGAGAPTDLTLKDLLDSPVNESKIFENSFVFVAQDATLADAKLKMDALKNCNDVFVTKTGNRTEPLLGWITDNTIAENSKV